MASRPVQPTYSCRDDDGTARTEEESARVVPDRSVKSKCLGVKSSRGCEITNVKVHVGGRAGSHRAGEIRPHRPAGSAGPLGDPQPETSRETCADDVAHVNGAVITYPTDAPAVLV